MNKINAQYIVFDFNGTLINDIDICLFLLNKMLKEKGHQGNIDKEKYLSIFTFPIIKYYEDAGFIFPEDDFAALAKEFDIDYRNAFPSLNLFDDVVEVLTYFKKMNKHLIVLSATKQTSLEDELKQKRIYDFFDVVIGIKDIFGRSKVDEAVNYFSSLNIDMKDVVFIGDTLHDNEVAEKLVSNSILVARGHQSKQRLLDAKNALVIDTLKELENVIE